MLKRESRMYGSKSSLVSFWTSRIGLRFGDSERLEATSPALHADRVRCPILLMHGRNDPTVAFEQSEFMRDALQQAGKTGTFVALDTDDHCLTLAAPRIEMRKDLEKFLGANIGN